MSVISWNPSVCSETTKKLKNCQAWNLLVWSCAYRMKMSGNYTQRRKIQKTFTDLIESSMLTNLFSFVLIYDCVFFRLTCHDKGLFSVMGEENLNGPRAAPLSCHHTEGRIWRYSWRFTVAGVLKMDAAETVDRTRSLRSWIQLTAHSHARLVRALPNHYHYLSCSLLERQRHTQEQTGGDRKWNNTFNVYSTFQRCNVLLCVD